MGINTVLLMSATGEKVDGPVVRVPPGSWRVDKEGSYSNCRFRLDDSGYIELNGHIVLSHYTSVQLIAQDAKNLTIRLVG